MTIFALNKISKLVLYNNNCYITHSNWRLF